MISERKNHMTFSREENPYNLTWPEWIEKWWKWCAPYPLASNPASDPTGKICGKNQNEPRVWFLAGTFGGYASRHCTVTGEKGILFPLVNDLISSAEYSQLKTDQDLHDYARADLNTAHSLRASIDGTELPYLERCRVHTRVFDLNVFIPGRGTVMTSAVSDGYWVFVHSLQQGHHKILFGGKKAKFDEIQNRTDDGNIEIPTFQVSVSYDLVIK